MFTINSFQAESRQTLHARVFVTLIFSDLCVRVAVRFLHGVHTFRARRKKESGDSSFDIALSRLTSLNKSLEI